MIRKISVTGRLNAFQRLMYQWSELHPYNATHIYKLAGPVRVEALREAIRETFLLNHCGVAELDSARGTYTHETDYAPEVELVASGSSPEQTLCEQVTRDLNRPFERPRCRPFRFSAFAAGPESHYLTVTYDHWTSDSIAARLLMRHVLGRYYGLGIPENTRPFQLTPATYRAAFADRWGVAGVIRSTWRALTNWFENRKAVQIPYSATTQMEVVYELHHTAPGTVPRLRAFAKAHGATVHDVILAALARAVSEALPRRAVFRDRPTVIGTIVDTRGDATEDLGETLGAFLGYYLVNCQPGQAPSLADLTHRVAAATRPIKAGRKYLDSLVQMKLISALWPWLSERVRPHFLRKTLPVAAGISNVHLRDSWFERDGAGRILEFHRASPTGPMVPLILTPTTLGEQLNLGVTYRATGFSRAKIDTLIARFLDQIEHPDAVSLPERNVRPAESLRHRASAELV